MVEWALSIDGGGEDVCVGNGEEGDSAGNGKQLHDVGVKFRSQSVQRNLEVN